MSVRLSHTIPPGEISFNTSTKIECLSEDEAESYAQALLVSWGGGGGGGLSLSLSSLGEILNAEQNSCVKTD